MKLTLLFIAVLATGIGFAQTTGKYANQEISYGHKDGMALTMVKLPPTTKDKHKAILSLVSGNWISSYGMLERYAEGAQIYADNGYTVFMVMHGSQPRYSIADEAEDIKRAVRYVRFHAKELGIDSAHIGITGSSSGGHLSLLTALTSDTINMKAADPVDRVSSRVQAAAVFFPPTDFLNWGVANTPIMNPNLKRFGVAGAFDFKELSDSTGLYEHIRDLAAITTMARRVSPIYQVSSDDPPIFITHGDADAVVPIQQSEMILKKLQEAGVKNEFLLHPGGGHGWKNNEVEKREFIKWFDKWLK